MVSMHKVLTSMTAFSVVQGRKELAVYASSGSSVAAFVYIDVDIWKLRSETHKEISNLTMLFTSSLGNLKENVVLRESLTAAQKAAVDSAFLEGELVAYRAITGRMVVHPGSVPSE